MILRNLTNSQILVRVQILVRAFFVIQLLAVITGLRLLRVRLVPSIMRLLLALLDLRPTGVGVLESRIQAVRDEDVVEDGTGIHGPQLEPDRADVVEAVNVLDEVLVRQLLR